MEWFHIILAGITVIYLALCTWWDLKEREIYTFPSAVLSILWVSYTLAAKQIEPNVIFLHVVVFMVLLVTFNITKTWGGGDSDLLVLQGCVFLAQMKAPFTIMDICNQCIALVVVLLVAVFIGFIEAKVKGEKLEKGSSIAIAPGYAVVISGLIIGGFIR